MQAIRISGFAGTGVVGVLAVIGFFAIISGIATEIGKIAVLKLHKDKASRVETYLDCEDKEYKVIMEEVKKDV